MFMAGLVQGCTGFGMALVAAPCLMLFLPTAVCVPAIVFSSTLNSFLVAFEARRHIRPKLVIPLIIGGFIGSPLGVHALTVIDDVHLKLGVGLFVATVAVALLAGWRLPLSEGAGTMLPVGILSGFFGGSTSMGGPPVVLFLANRDTPREAFRANLVGYFFVVNCMSICVFFVRGLVTSEVATYAGAFVPTMLLGTWIGVRLSRTIPEALFSRIVMVFVGFTGLVLFLSNLSV